MRILVFCPLNPSMPRLWGQTVTSIFKMEWGEPIEYLFRANDNPYPNGGLRDKYLNVTHNYNFARRYTIGGRYDALLCVEADMILPPDTLRRLVACDADVAYGLYVFRHTRHTWSAYIKLGDRHGRSLSQEPEQARDLWGRVIDVQGVGLGCTLIRRQVLEQLDFHLHPEVIQTCCDWLLARDCVRHGFTQRCDTGLVCGHLTYKPFPQVFWPDPSERRMYRQEALDGVKFAPYPIGNGNKIEVPVGMGRTEVHQMPATEG